MYPEIMVVPMREELTRLGVEELRTAADVDRVLQGYPGSTMVIVNSICGCAAGRMRPAVRLALQHATIPANVVSVFAGHPPSSPSIAILRNGKLVYMMQRHEIERREAPAIAADLKAAFDQHCAVAAAR